MTHRLTSVFLLLSGLILLAIGGAILFVPHDFHASNDIVLGDDPSLLSEIRAPGGLLTASAILILIGVFRVSLRPLAMTLNVLAYGSFGLARLVGVALDGIPASGLVVAIAIELVVATIGLAILLRQPRLQEAT